MSIYVVRHGQTDYNVKKLYQGRKDIPLNEIGKKQAMEMAEKFRDIKIDKIFVSPLTRAKQTAECISKITGVLPEIEDGLKDVPSFIVNNSTLLDTLVNNKIASSRREAREFLKNGSITINGEKVSDENLIIDTKLSIGGKVIIIRKGKKKYYLGIIK